jgi:ribonuclease P protein component
LLARENRLLKADDFRSTMKLGRKIASDHLVTYIQRDESQAHPRFGFIVAKSVGGAVTRNLVKRRLRAIARELLQTNLTTTNLSIVVRALEGASVASFDQLKSEVLSSVSAGIKKLA